MGKKIPFIAIPNLPKTAWEGEKTCIVGISVGQAYHEGRRLRAIFDFAANNFAEVIILVADSLRRYSLSLKYEQPPEALWDEALQLGDEWLQRNQKALDRFSNPYRITRYRDWVTHSEFSARIAQVRTLYDDNRQVQDAVDQDIVAYLKRYNGRGPKKRLEVESSYYACREFLLEEIAVCSLLSEKWGVSLETYPGNMLKTFRIFSSGILPIDNSHDTWQWRNIPLKLEKMTTDAEKDH